MARLYLHLLSLVPLVLPQQVLLYDVLEHRLLQLCRAVHWAEASEQLVFSLLQQGGGMARLYLHPLSLVPLVLPRQVLLYDVLEHPLLQLCRGHLLLCLEALPPRPAALQKHPCRSRVRSPMEGPAVHAPFFFLYRALRLMKVRTLLVPSLLRLRTALQPARPLPPRAPGRTCRPH